MREGLGGAFAVRPSVRAMWMSPRNWFSTPLSAWKAPDRRWLVAWTPGVRGMCLQHWQSANQDGNSLSRRSWPAKHVAWADSRAEPGMCPMTACGSQEGEASPVRRCVPGDRQPSGGISASRPLPAMPRPYRAVGVAAGVVFRARVGMRSCACGAWQCPSRMARGCIGPARLPGFVRRGIIQPLSSRSTDLGGSGAPLILDTLWLPAVRPRR